MPSILQRLFPNGMTALSSRVTSGIKTYSETPGVLWASRPTSSAGVVVDEEEALTLSAVFAGCYRLAVLQSQLPIGIYERATAGRVEKPENPASNLLNVQMSPEQTAFTGRFFMDFWKPLFGAACAEIVWDMAARASKIYPIGPWRVEVKEDERTDELYYLVDGRRRIHPDDMLYVPHISSDGVTGKGFVHYAIESLGSAIAADRAAGRFFKNDMRPGGMLKHPGTPAPEARKRFRDEWRENHSGDKQGSIGVLWGGWDWIKDSGAIDPNRAQLLECTTPETLITMADGTRKQAGEVEAGDSVLGFDHNAKRMVQSRVERVADNGVHPVLRIRTHRGREVTVTKNHPFWASERLRTEARKNSYVHTETGLLPGWVFADKLKVNDYISTSGEVNWQGTGEVSASDAYLVGAMVGDGHIRKTGSMMFTNADEEVVDAVRNSLAVHGAELKLYKKYGYGIRANCATGRPRLGNNNRIRMLFGSLDLLGTESHNKFVPDAIFRSGRAAVAAFLAGYFDTDGTVTKPGVKAPLLVATSASRDLAEGVQHGLSLLGINASVRFQEGISSFDQPYKRWELVVAGGRNIKAFARQVALMHPGKRERLAIHAGESRREEKPDFSVFDRIVSIEELEPQPTIAITVEDTHSHLTNGLISHNTRQYSVLEVARWLNVPVHWLGDLTRSTWGNIEHQAIETLTHVVMPLLVAKEQEYDRKLLNPPRLYSKHNVNALLRGDMKARAEFYRLMKEIGGINTNEIRAFEDMNGIGPEGDTYFVPLNWQPQDDLQTGLTAAKEMKPDPAPAADAKPADKPAAPKKKAAMSVAGVLEHLLTMLSKKECNEANRASKKPKDMMAWMDGFYPAFKSQMESAIHPAADLAFSLSDDLQFDWTEWSSEWCEASKAQLLDAMDGPPEEWPNRMTELLGRWQSRPAEMALEWTKPLLLKEMSDV